MPPDAVTSPEVPNPPAVVALLAVARSVGFQDLDDLVFAEATGFQLAPRGLLPIAWHVVVPQRQRHGRLPQVGAAADLGAPPTPSPIWAEAGPQPSWRCCRNHAQRWLQPAQQPRLSNCWRVDAAARERGEGEGSRTTRKVTGRAPQHAVTAVCGPA
jgi:hypothetical protein